MVTVNTVIADPTLSSTSKLVMIYILEIVRQTGDTEIPFKDDEVSFKVGRAGREIYRSLEELAAKGYIKFGKAARKTRVRVVNVDLVANESLEEMLTYF
jgi:predicted transcriptional regulator